MTLRIFPATRRRHTPGALRSSCQARSVHPHPARSIVTDGDPRRGRTAPDVARNVRRSPTSSALSPSGGCSPTSASPTSCSWRPKPPATGGSSSARSDPRLVRRCIGRTGSARSSPGLSAPSSARRGPPGRSSWARCSRRTAPKGCASPRSPCVTTAVPVGVLTREWSPAVGRQPGEVERTYLEIFERFARMISDGEFPMADERTSTSAMPRVGDGVMLLDASQRVEYASPNAVSALHRVGVQGTRSACRRAGRRRPHRAVRVRVRGTRDRGVEYLPEVVVLVRCLPLLKMQGQRKVVLVRGHFSVSRRRDRILRKRTCNDP